jgi:hypothetical protein
LVNDIVKYYGNSKIPIEHHIIQDHKGGIIPKGVYSDDIEISYFGYSKEMKIFSTEFVNNNLNRNFTIEYIYEAKGLLKSFSDFRTDASYGNITYNYNMLNWKFNNLNDNKHGQNLKIEILFDLGPDFSYEPTKFSFPFTKTHIHIPHDNNSITNIVKFSSNKILHYNETLSLEAKFPLYFETCKYYNLNLMVFATKVVFICLFFFIIIVIVKLICSSIK